MIGSAAVTAEEKEQVAEEHKVVLATAVVLALLGSFVAVAADEAADLE